jgi:hypothetical protein
MRSVYGMFYMVLALCVPVMCYGIVRIYSLLSHEKEIAENQVLSADAIKRQWSALHSGYYHMTVTTFKAGHSHTIRQVEAWWRTDDDFFRIEVRDGSGKTFWVIVKRGRNVWSIHIPARKMQHLILREPGVPATWLDFHPYSVLWQRASLDTVQRLASDPLAAYVWSPIRINERVIQQGNDIVWGWEYSDGSATVSTYLQTATLLPASCQLAYSNGKTVCYRYTIVPHNRMDKRFYKLPAVSHVDTLYVENAFVLGTTVELLRPSPPDAAMEGPGEPDRFSGEYTDWFSAEPGVRTFGSLQELYAHTTVAPVSLPKSWGKPRTILYVHEEYASNIPPLEVVRLVFERELVGTYRIEIQQLPKHHSFQVEDLLRFADETASVRGRRVYIYAPKSSAPGWSAAWYDESNRQIVQLDYVGEQKVLFQLVTEFFQK